jgi:hypothetical protein
MIAGGTEAAITPMGVGGFAAMRALSTRNDDPEKASRPWDSGRDGFVIGEGAGILVLEELEFARRRGARIMAEVMGYGMSGDAFHITQPAENGDGAYRVMMNTLRDAKVQPEQVQYINAHGTSTDIGDKLETIAIKRAFGDHAYSWPSATRSCRQPSIWRIPNRTAIWTTSPTRPAKRKLSTLCRIRSASVGPTALCCSGAGASRAGVRLQPSDLSPQTSAVS